MSIKQLKEEIYGSGELDYGIAVVEIRKRLETLKQPPYEVVDDYINEKRGLKLRVANLEGLIDGTETKIENYTRNVRDSQEKTIGRVRVLEKKLAILQVIVGVFLIVIPLLILNLV